MNPALDEEKLLRRRLARFRAVATIMQRIVSEDETLYAEAPQRQAEALIEGSIYKIPSMLMIETAVATGQLKLGEACLHCSKIATRAQKTAKAERLLKEKFDPVEVTREVTLPLLKDWLENIESYMVEHGYRVPKWHRPNWLTEMEAKQ